MATYAIDFKEYARQMRENAVIDDYGRVICSHELWLQIAHIIENIPTADVKEVKRGHWNDEHKESFCPNCGAKMDGERKE